MRVKIRQWAVYTEGDDTNAIWLFTTAKCDEEEARAIAIAQYGQRRFFRLVDEGTFNQEVPE